MTISKSVTSIHLPFSNKKIKSLEIIFRTNTNIEIWDQNKKRLFEKPKIEYAIKSINCDNEFVAVFKVIKLDIEGKPCFVMFKNRN